MSGTVSLRRARAALVAVGLTTSVAQAVLLREAMAALGGSELAWGAVLALWLAGVGAGAWAGARRRRAGGLAAAAAVAAAALLGVIVLRAAPWLSGSGAGETLVAWSAVWVWVAAVLPAAAAGGAAFAFAASSLPGEGAGGAAYALEAGGAAAGGLAFTFLLAPLGSAGSLLVTGAVPVALSLVWGGRRALAGLVALVAAVTAWPASVALERAGWRWAGRSERLAAWRETHEQRLELGVDGTKSLFADGRLIATLPDPYRAGPRAHLVLLLHPRPERVWMVGGLADGGAAIMLRHPVRRLAALEEDRALAALLPAWLGAELAPALRDPRLELLTGDPLRALRPGGGWDLVVLLDGDPSTVRRNRTRTEGFFRRCGAALAPGGMVVVRVQAGDTYLGGEGGRLIAIEAATLRAALGHVAAIPGEEVMLVGWKDGAGPSLDPAVLQARWRALGLHDTEFDAALVEQLVDPGRVPALQRFVAETSAPIDTAARPSAVLPAASLIEARGHPPLVSVLTALGDASPWWAGIAVVGVALSLVLARLSGIGPAGPSEAIVGATSMGWWLLLLSAWQSTVGSVFSEVGALSAAFMAGLAGGAWLARGFRGDARLRLAALLLGGAAFSLFLALGAPLALPRVVVVPSLLLGGVLAGVSFPVAVALRGPRASGGGAARMFSADEAGAAGGALAVGLIGLPWLGAAGVGAVLAAIGVVAAIVLLGFRGRREDGA